MCFTYLLIFAIVPKLTNPGPHDFEYQEPSRGGLHVIITLRFILNRTTNINYFKNKLLNCLNFERDKLDSTCAVTSCEASQNVIFLLG